MKLHILSEHLQKKLLFVNHAVSTRGQLPVLSHFLLETYKGKLQISATDLEIGIQTEIAANIEEEGGITVPAKIFFELISTLQEEKITLESKENILEVTTKKTKSLFQTISKEEFPKLYEEKGTEIAHIQKEAIIQDFSKVVFAASIDIARPALSGILLKRDAEGFIIVATDGYRLSLKHNSHELKNAEEEEKPTLIPGRVIRELIGIKQEEDILVYISKKNNQVLFVQNETTLIGRLIEADFPNYEKIIPSDFGTRALFDKEEMQRAVKTCSIFARETANIVKFSLLKDPSASFGSTQDKSSGQGKIIISANTPSVGQNSVDVEAHITGEDNEIAFNCRYLLDLFSNIEETDMIFEMGGPLSPGVFKLQEDPSFLHIIMPIRVQG